LSQHTHKKSRRTRATERELSRLQSELRAERRRTAALEREVAELRRQLQATSAELTDRPLRRLRQRVKGTDREALLMEAAGRRAHHYRKGSFLRYLWESVMESAPVRILSNLIHYLRRVRAVQLILTVLAALGAVVTVALVSAAVLPFLLFWTATLAILAYARSRHMNRILRKELSDKTIRVMIPPRGGAFGEGSFFIRNARAMAADGVAVLVVSPYPLSSRGLGGKGGFFTARREAEGLYLVRRHYFFMLRKRVLDALEQDITVVY